MTLALVLIGGAIGAPLRYLVDLAVQSRQESLFPWGTLTVNLVGSLLVGVVAAAAVEGGASTEWLLVLVGTGFCGALTTFSTFGFETVRLLEEGEVLTALTNGVVSLVGGLVACVGGYAAAAALL